MDEALKDWTVLWDYGALLALTDCVYKSMIDHGFAYIIDLDEFIVPQVIITRILQRFLCVLLNFRSRFP